jgi:hypothetical protein
MNRTVNNSDKIKSQRLANKTISTHPAKKPERDPVIWAQIEKDSELKKLIEQAEIDHPEVFFEDTAVILRNAPDIVFDSGDSIFNGNFNNIVAMVRLSLSTLLQMKKSNNKNILRLEEDKVRDKLRDIKSATNQVAKIIGLEAISTLIFSILPFIPEVPKDIIKLLENVPALAKAISSALQTGYNATLSEMNGLLSLLTTKVQKLSTEQNDALSNVDQNLASMMSTQTQRV